MPGLDDGRASKLSHETGQTGHTDKSMGAQESMANFGNIDEEEHPLPWSAGYVVACLMLPLVNGCLTKSFWSCFTLYYVRMSWPLWRCGLAISSGALVHCLSQTVVAKVGIWTSIPLSLIHLIFAILGLVFIDQEWAIFAQMVCLLGLDAKVASEGVAYEWFHPQEVSFGMQASGAVIATFTMSSMLSFTIGGLIYEFTGWEGMAIFHIISQGLIFLLLLLAPPCWRSMKRFTSGQEAQLSMNSILPEEAFDVSTPTPQAPIVEESQETSAAPAGEAASEATRGDRPTTLAWAQDRKTALGPSAQERPSTLGISAQERPSTLGAGAQERPSTLGAGAQERGKVVGRGTVGRGSMAGRGSTTRGSVVNGRGSMLSVSNQVRGSRISGFQKNFMASRTTTFSQAGVLKGRSSNWSKAISNVSINALESHFAVDPDLHVALAARTGQRFKLEDVAFDIRFPITLVALTNWAFHFSLFTELASYALLLARQGWTSAVWAGLAQSGGEVLCLLLTLLKSCLTPEEAEVDEDEDMPRPGLLYRWYFLLTTEPYAVTLCLLAFATINYCFLIPEAAGIVVAQVLFSTVNTFANKAAHDLYVLYSCMTNPDMLYTVVTFGWVAGAIGAIMAGILTLGLYEISEELPFLLSGGVCVAMCIQYTFGFCFRVGTDILTSEADRG